MAPLAEIDGVQLISLQKGKGSEQLSRWDHAQRVFCLPEEVDQTSGAFMDTAAILQELDVVVTSDTALAHLAGSLGVKTCVVLGFTPDWRWLQYRSDTPWYPSVRLFRQTEIGEWSSILEEVARSLRNELLDIDRNTVSSP